MKPLSYSSNIFFRHICAGISVVAFDNTYLSGALTPALTSVGANYTEFAKHLVEAAIRASENETCPEDYMVPVGISVRDSCTHVP